MGTRRKQAKAGHRERLSERELRWIILAVTNMRKVQKYILGGKWVTRTYTANIGRTKGTKNKTYNLSEEGLKSKQQSWHRLITQLREEGRAGWPKGKVPTVQHRLKNSIAVRKAIADGRLDPKANIRKYVASDKFEPRSNHGTHGIFYSKKNKQEFRYDSSWELTRMLHFEKDAAIKSYRKNPIRLLYVIKKEQHYYWPDFLIEYTNGEQVLEEVKPIGLTRTLEVRKKFCAARLYCVSAGIIFRVIGSAEALVA